MKKVYRSNRMNRIIPLSVASISISTASFLEGSVVESKTPELKIKGRTSGALYSFKQGQRSSGGGKGYGTSARIEDSKRGRE